MKRRALIGLGLAGTAAGLLLPQRLLAQSSVHVGGPLAGGVYYTRESPGRWSKKAADHLPRLRKADGPGGTVTVTVTTDHVMNGYRHYIVKHMLLDRDFQFVGEKMFDPERDDPVSTYSLLPGYEGPVYALSMCNKHDLWLEGMIV